MRTLIGATLGALAIAIISSWTPADAMPPLPGQRCLGSPAALGTSNLPANSDLKTTVIDALAYRASKGAVGWLYVTRLRQWWFQASSSSKDDVARALRRRGLRYLAQRISESPDSFGGSGIYPVANGDLRSIERAMAALGARRWTCFSSPLEQ